MSYPSISDEFFLAYEQDVYHNPGMENEGLRQRQSDQIPLVHEPLTALESSNSSIQDSHATSSLPILSFTSQMFDPDTIHPFIKSADEPSWSSTSVRGAGAGPSQPRSFRSTGIPASLGDHTFLMPPTVGRCSRPQSDVGSHDDRSRDSGYQTQTATAGRSPSSPTFSATGSHPWFSSNQSCPTEQLYTSNAYSFPSTFPQSPASEEVRSTYQGSQRSANKKRQHRFQCNVCPKTFKTQSEANKHRNTHAKRFRCDIPNCSRDEGFSTANDLDRHRTSVHHLPSVIREKKGHICAICTKLGDKKQGKFWPRKDNFKAHILRKHKPDTGDTAEIARYLEQIYNVSEADRPDDAATAILTEYPENMSQRDVHDEHDLVIDTAYAQAVPGLPDVRSSAAEVHGMEVDMHSAPLGHTLVNALDLPPSSMSGSSSGPSYTRQDYHTTCLSFAYHESELHDTKAGSGYNHDPSLDTAAVQYERDPSPKGMSSSFFEIEPNGSFSCNHPGCGKVMKRGCDLRKHAKRHTRPYGCTFHACTSKFGSRNDWKRHENTQHFLPAMWKCHLGGDDRRSLCDFPAVQDQDRFCQHLRKAHKVESDGELKRYCTQFKLGREGNNSFWCGFCREVVQQDRKAVQAWKVRGDHIGDHFDKENRKIEDWFCVESNRCKRELERDARAQGMEEENDLSAYEPDIPTTGRQLDAPYFLGDSGVEALDPCLAAADHSTFDGIDDWD